MSLRFPDGVPAAADFVARVPIVCRCRQRFGTARGYEWMPRGRLWWTLTDSSRRTPDYDLIGARQFTTDAQDRGVRLRCSRCRYDLPISYWSELWPLLDGLPAGEPLTVQLISAFYRTQRHR